MTLEKRPFGPEAWPVSILGFGCGAVGGLMVRGAPADQERAVTRALEAGVNYFDTAVQYGNGASEENLGRILADLRPRDALVGTKVRIAPEETGRIADAVRASLEASLRRLRREQVDIFHLHNPITDSGGDGALSLRQVLDEVVPAFQALRAAGKLRIAGITAIGETHAVQQAVDSGAFGSAQVSYNMLNPSAGAALPASYPAQDYERLLDHTRDARVGVIAIRVLAGGALSGTDARHPVASPPPAPIGSARDYATDLARAQRLLPLVAEGYAGTLAEAAIRFVIAHQAVGTVLVGMANIAEFEAALAAALKGPLPPEALRRVAALTGDFAGEAR
jgi:aryl-alcohol dehydrogenase-like predicted oxidoreductase